MEHSTFLGTVQKYLNISTIHQKTLKQKVLLFTPFTDGKTQAQRINLHKMRRYQVQSWDTLIVILYWTFARSLKLDIIFKEWNQKANAPSAFERFPLDPPSK